jgi:bis(5'-nucleosyl)-tetraphosphatase (symmetrical)
MATYLVGDIQGCYIELKALLEQVNFNKESDILYLAGDLVARGEDSLNTLRFVKSLGASAKVVLGNHDLHLLAIHAGLRKAKASDKFDSLLSAPDVEELIDWLATKPLIEKITCNLISVNDEQAEGYMSHAGCCPQWDLATALEQANSAQQKISSTDRHYWLKNMYGEEPNNWQDANSDIEKFRYTINACTRMRYCFQDGSLEFKVKESPEEVAEQHKNAIVPWFSLSKTITKTPWVFGHWASLMGVCPQKNAYALDTGCVWGGHLTMLRWHDKKVFTQAKF